jgi:hypothetical protein
VNVWWIRSAARSSASWALMITECTASVISTNATSWPNSISGTPRRSAADTSASGSPETYRLPSSIARPLTLAEASAST